MFTDRVHAGSLLARKLFPYRDSGGIVFGLPRGGVVVAVEIARNLNLPLEVLVVKKMGAPGNSELAIGAVAPDGVSFVDQEFASMVGADERYVKSQKSKVKSEIEQKILLYQKGRKPRSVKGKTAIVVDDGAATGATVRAAVAWLRKKKAGKIIIALPVAPFEFVEKMKGKVDDLVVSSASEDFSSVGQFYEYFPQVTDEEVIELLK